MNSDPQLGVFVTRKKVLRYPFVTAFIVIGVGKVGQALPTCPALIASIDSQLWVARRFGKTFDRCHA